MQQLLANDMADVAAGIAVGANVSPHEAEMKAADMQQLALAIAKRLAAVEAISWRISHGSESLSICLPPSPKVSTPAVANRDLWDQIEAAGHRPTPVRLDDTGLLLRCSMCGLATHSKKKNSVWLRSPCVPSAALDEGGKLTGVFREPPVAHTTCPPEVGQPAAEVVNLSTIRAAAKERSSLIRRTPAFQQRPPN